MIRGRDLFLDIDGVFGDFDGHYFSIFGRATKVDDPTAVPEDELWANIRSIPGWFTALPVMPGALLMWDAFKRYEPTFLSGCDPLKYPTGEPEKRAWVTRHFGDVPLIVCESKDKRKHGRPGDILVDDRTKYRAEWTGMGGYFIHHVSPGQTIAEVEALMP